MKENKLSGKRYISLVRCSTHGQADTSIDDQLNVIKAFAAQHAMVHVDDVVLDGVSGSMPGARRDIEEVVRRKETKDDFDVLVVQDSSRLTRGGALHGAKIEYDLRAAGIRVLYASDSIPEGEYADVIKSLHFTAAKEHAKSISFTSTRGAMSALIDGRSAYCRRPPFGVDRLYVQPDGTPIHVIRNLADGTQVQLDPETREVTRRYGRNEGSGAPSHYIKQKDERIVLIPGDEQHIEIVRRIFARYHVDGNGCFRIAAELNSEGIVSPQGRAWTVSTIRSIILNPVYLGLGIANRYSSAIYHMRSPDAPTRAEVDDQVLATRRRPPRKTRSRTEWRETKQEQLANLLDEEVQLLAKAKQDRHLDAQAAGRSPKPNRDRHRQSDFFLKGILRSKQGDFPMTGRRTGRQPRTTRYYAVGRAFSAPTGEALMRRMIPAEPIEQAILQVVQQLLMSMGTLAETLRAAFRRQAKQNQVDQGEVAKLKADRDSAQRKLEYIIDELEAVGREALKAKTNRLQAEIRSLDERIKRASAAPTTSTMDENKSIQRIVDQLAQLGEKLDSLPAPATHRLVASFVSRAVVDLETRDVEVELGLPEWALSGQNPMCLDGDFSWKNDFEAHQPAGMCIQTARLIWDRGRREYGVVDFAAAA